MGGVLRCNVNTPRGNKKAEREEKGKKRWRKRTFVRHADPWSRKTLEIIVSGEEPQK